MAVNLFFMALMPFSQIVSWYLILKTDLDSALLKTTLFYLSWALYKKFIRKVEEGSHFGYGVLLLTLLSNEHNHKLGGVFVVWLTYLLAILLTLTEGPMKIAKAVTDGSPGALTQMWIGVFLLFLFSNLAFYSYAMKLLLDISFPQSPLFDAVVTKFKEMAHGNGGGSEL